MIKISVIVPVYNTEKYLGKCLDSLVNQTLENIEIIIVNDGSLDNSQRIIDKYDGKYSFIKSFRKENGGLSDARNFGIKRATGEYIGFVDSDDWVELDMFEKMYNKAIKSDFDIVSCNLTYRFKKENRDFVRNGGITKDILLHKDKKKFMITMYPTVWNKIYKKKLFRGENKFKKGIWFEDFEFLYRILPEVKSIGYVDYAFYNYLQRPGAITDTINDKLYDYIENWNAIIFYYKKNNMFEYYYDELEYCYVRYLYAVFLKRAYEYKFEEFKKAVEFAFENVQKNFPKYKMNKYIYLFPSFKNLYITFVNKKVLLFMKKHIKILR